MKSITTHVFFSTAFNTLFCAGVRDEEFATLYMTDTRLAHEWDMRDRKMAIGERTHH